MSDTLRAAYHKLKREAGAHLFHKSRLVCQQKKQLKCLKRSHMCGDDCWETYGSERTSRIPAEQEHESDSAGWTAGRRSCAYNWCLKDSCDEHMTDSNHAVQPNTTGVWAISAGNWLRSGEIALSKQGHFWETTKNQLPHAIRREKSFNAKINCSQKCSAQDIWVFALITSP